MKAIPTRRRGPRAGAAILTTSGKTLGEAAPHLAQVQAPRSMGCAAMPALSRLTVALIERAFRQFGGVVDLAQPP
jgi:hypothetical protein